jgi:hypothetical protein
MYPRLCIVYSSYIHRLHFVYHRLNIVYSPSLHCLNTVSSWSEDGLCIGQALAMHRIVYEPFQRLLHPNTYRHVQCMMYKQTIDEKYCEDQSQHGGRER